MDKKEFMKKVVAILEKQQATLKKLAEKILMILSFMKTFKRVILLAGI